MPDDAWSLHVCSAECLDRFVAALAPASAWDGRASAPASRALA